jgi:cobalt-zinc-cadmium efflux system membrane fusion protein
MKSMKHIVLICSVAFLLASCHHEEKKAETLPFNCLNDTMLSQIELDTVKSDYVKHELKMTGKITFDQEHTQKIYPLASGRVLAVKAELGDFVTKGQVLAVVSSSEAADYENQTSAAESKLAIAEKNLSVAKDMYEDGLTSQKEYTTAQKEYEIAKAEFKKLQEVLKIYNVSGSSTYTIKAPISGYIVEKKLTPDFYIRTDNNENLFTISDISNVWVMVNLYEVDLTKIQVGYDAEVRTLSYQDKVFQGVVDKIFNVVDPDTKTLKARIKLHNPDYSLKPEMFAKVVLFYADNRQMPEVPSNAVIFSNNKRYVMVYKDRCHIETRAIEVGDEFRNSTYVKFGVKTGERVISKMQLLVFNQLNQH